MDITHYIVSHRNKNVQLNGYNGYYTHASRELAAIRKKVGRSTPKGKKYAGALPVSAEDVASKPEFVSLLLLTAERAWAQAMHLKSLRTATGPTETLASSARKHIVSRLQRACKISQQLLAALSDRETSHSTEEDFLEAHAYSSLLVGGCEFERRRWKECLRAYAMAWMVYTALQGSISERIRKEDLKDLLSTVVDPSLRYAAYKMQIPRSHQISAIALQFLPRDGNDDVLSLINHLKPNLMSDIDPAKAASPASKAAEADGGSRIVTWRSRIVKIEDAAISQALGDVEEASAKLSRLLDSSAGPQLAKGKAAAYDEVLSASQDAVDATKHAIDELGAEGVGSSDARMQALQVTRTAVNYGLIGWRVGRNRILAGEQDGAVVETSTTKGLTRKKPLLAEGKEAPMPEGTKRRKAEGRGRLVGRLRERVVLYDGILQSIDSIKELAGVAADEPLMTDLQAKRSYFQALKCLAIARSHVLLSTSHQTPNQANANSNDNANANANATATANATANANALALLSRALDLCKQCSASLPSTSPQPCTTATVTTPTSRPTLDLSPASVQTLQSLLERELVRQQALVVLSQQPPPPASTLPLIETLHQYPTHMTTDMRRTPLVRYPPIEAGLLAIPMQPIFLDLARNYIDYPGRETTGSGAARKGKATSTPVQPTNGLEAEAEAEAETEQTEASRPGMPAAPKRSWFGFGWSK